MADRYGSICMLQQVADWASYDITPAYHDCEYAIQVDSTLFQQYHNALWCARNEEWLPITLGKLSNIGRTKTIDILLICDSRCDGMLREMIGR